MAITIARVKLILADLLIEVNDLQDQLNEAKARIVELEAQVKSYTKEEEG